MKPLLPQYPFHALSYDIQKHDNILTIVDIEFDKAAGM